MPKPIVRHAEAEVLAALADTRIVAVEGPRQAGKSTLCTAVAQRCGMSQSTLDDEQTRRAAREDAAGFVASVGSSAFLDEVQRAPELILALKAAVDRDPRPGRFLVTGSASLLLSPKVGDSLAGRVARIPLRPFTQAEIAGGPVPRWLDRLWSGVGPPSIEAADIGRGAHAAIVAAGGFPEAGVRAGRRRRAWFDDYLAALVSRDIPDLVDVRRPDVLPVLLRQLASSSGLQVAARPVAQALAVDEKTVRTYIRLLELLHLVVSVPAWTPGAGSRAVRTPRTFIEDSGLLTHLLDADADRIATDDTVTGRAYETFMAMELSRLLPFTDVAPTVRHWRDHHGHEVDIVLEDRRGRIIGIELKAGATVGPSDLRGMRRLQELAGERFVAGIVLTTGRQTLPFGARTWVVPMQALWLSGG